MKRPNISVMRIPQNAEREAGFENVFNEIIKKKNFPNVEKELGNRIEDGYRTPSIVEQSNPHHNML